MTPEEQAREWVKAHLGRESTLMEGVLPLYERIAELTQRLDAEAQTAALLRIRVDQEQQRTEQAEARVKELEAKLREAEFVPGEWRCPKCRFVAMKAIFNAVSGNVATDIAAKFERCPNRCGLPLERLTWAQDRRDASDAMSKWADAAEFERALADKLAAALRGYGKMGTIAAKMSVLVLGAYQRDNDGAMRAFGSNSAAHVANDLAGSLCGFKVAYQDALAAYDESRKP